MASTRIIVLVFVSALSAFAQTAKWPTAVAGNADIPFVCDSSMSTITADVNNVQTTINVADGSRFCLFQMIRVDAEKMFVTAKNGNILTVTRAVANTTADIHTAAGANCSGTNNSGPGCVRGEIYAWIFNSARAEILAMQANLLPSYDVSSLPSTCTPKAHYTRNSDNTLHRCNNAGNGYDQISGGTGGGGSGSVSVNGSTVSNPNFNNTTPAPESGYTNVKFQVNGSNISAEISTPAAEGPYDVDTTSWPSTATYPSSCQSVPLSTHARGSAAWGKCFATIDANDNDDALCRIIYSKTTPGNMSFCYVTKPGLVRIFRGDKAPGPVGPQGPTGAAIGGLLTTKGDTVTHNGTNAVRQGTCPDGQAFIADSTQTTGWRCAAGGGSGNGAINCFDASGSGSAYACPSAGSFTLSTGVMVQFKPGTTSSANPTLSVSGTTAKSIIWKTGTNVGSGEMVTTKLYLLRYNGVAYEVIDGPNFISNDGSLVVDPTGNVQVATAYPKKTAAESIPGLWSFGNAVQLWETDYATATPLCSASGE